jgi:tetratricopeptide (TPR) repeat protein
LNRRKFLLRCCQGASVAMLPAGFHRFPFAFPSASRLADRRSFDFPNSSSENREFHLHPNYRAKRPLDALLLTKAGSDEFVTEKYHDQIASILAQWTAALIRSPHETNLFEKSLSPGFLGSSLRPVNSRTVRSGSPVEVRVNTYQSELDLQKNLFLNEWQSELNVFSKILTAEFQVTLIDTQSVSSTGPPEQLKTRVRYEIVGTGNGFYREQRVGAWDLEWASSGDQFQLRRWQTLEETRSRSTSPVFADIAAAALGTNVSYSAQMLHDVDYWRTILDGACGIDIYGHNGVSVADIDNDGFDDLYICQLAGLPNRLYRNRGDGTFEDITESSGLGILENSSCALFADFDNDGRQDVVVVTASGPLLFVNEGSGKFRRKPDAFKFAIPPQGTFTGAAVADYDRDGWLDIYFCLYSYYQGTDQYKYPVPYHDAENGPPNFMMHNQRDGTFRDVTAESGLNQNNTRYSFCCSWCDYNVDGWPDLYVVNDFGRKNLYRNNGDGTFTDVAAQAGVEDIGAGMSVSWLDYNNHGTEDLYVGDMWTAAGERISSQKIFKASSPEAIRALYEKHAMGNSLFRNLGKDFRNETLIAGVGMGRWAWSSDAFDFDHDGYPDLYITNGMISGPSRDDLSSFFWRQVVAKSPDEAKPSPAYEQGWNAINELIRADGTWSGYERNVFYANNRDGTFSNISGAVGMDFLEDGRAFALADFDHDGRQEMFLKNRNAPQFRILKNVVEDLPPSIIFCLRGNKSNRDAIGAVVTIETETGTQTRELQAGSGFLSQHSKELFFGLGQAKGSAQASIRWPSGLVQKLHDLPANHRVWIEEGSDSFRVEAFKSGPTHERDEFTNAAPHLPEPLPETFQTWLLSPILAPHFSLPDVAGKVRTFPALSSNPLLLNFWSTQSSDCLRQLTTFASVHARWVAKGLQLLTVNLDDPPNAEDLTAFAREQHLPFPLLPGSGDVAAVYNILYRYLYDRHRDLSLPSSFLIDSNGHIVKLYQGFTNADQIEEDSRRIPLTSAERLALALPFPGDSETYTFGRNYLSYGSIFFQRGYFEQAGNSFRQALADDPTSAEAAYGLGSAYLSQQKNDDARTSFERATKLDASYPDTLPNAWNNLGLLSAHEDKTEEAIKYFHEALRLSPNHVIALDNLGNAYRQQKNWDAARNAFERAVEIDATDPDANYGLAMVYAQAGDTEHTYEYLQRALKARPDYPEALNNLGILYLRTQRRDDAVLTFELCIRVSPGFDQAYLNLARVYAIENTPEKARGILQELLTLQPNHAQARELLNQLPQ